MRKLLVTVVVSLLVFSCATEFNIVADDVPLVVASSFKAKYPDAKDVKWEVEKHENRLVYEAGWKDGKKEKEAVFKPDGTFVKEE